MMEDNNYIIEYWEWINANKKNRKRTSTKVYKVYKELVRIMNDDKSEWEFDADKANHVITFIQSYCKHSKGAFGGKPLILELWQKALVSATFGIVHKIDETRKYQEVVLIVARKNGKSVLASAIALYMMIADGEPGAEVYAAATKRDQSRIIWEESKRMVQKSPILRKRIKPLVTEMKSEFNDGVFRFLGRDSNSLDGLNISCLLADELAAWTDQNLYDVLFDATSARESPLVFITSTMGTIRESVFDTKYDEIELVINGYEDPDGYKNERLLPIIYELDNRKDWTDEECWYQANPGLKSIKKIDQLRTKVEKAKANSMLVKNLLCKDFNVRETSSTTFLSFDELNNTATFDIAELQPRYCIAGIDLSSTTDLTCATILFRVPDDETIYVKQMFWLPSDLLEKRSKEDKVPYNLWYEQGLLRVSEGNKINFKDITQWLLEVQNELDIYIYKIGYDSWGSTYFVEELQQNFGKNTTIPVIQGAKTFSVPLSRIKADLGAKKINYNNNPITKWNLSNGAVNIDRNNNLALAKTSNPRKRIDGFASLMDAYIVYEDEKQNYLNMI